MQQDLELKDSKILKKQVEFLLFELDRIRRRAKGTMETGAIGKQVVIDDLGKIAEMAIHKVKSQNVR